MALIQAIVGTLLLGSVLAFTPEQMLAAPRRSTANVNPSGEWALFTSTSYNWTTHKPSTKWQLMNVDSGDITAAPFDSGISEVVWVGPSNTSILYINGTNDEIPGGVTLYTADIGASNFSPTLVASLGAPFQGLKAVNTDSGAIKFIVNCLAYANNGSAYNPDLASKSRSTGQLYDANFVRHWDVYLTAERYAIFSGILSSGYGGSYTFDGTIKNLLWGMQAPVTRPESPVQPFGDQGDYDLSPDGNTVAFLTKAPELPKANYTASYIYLVPHDASLTADRINGPDTTAPDTAKGASASPRWSPDGKKVAYCQQDGIAYESDRFKCYFAEITGLHANVIPVAEDWDSSPAFLQWSLDSENLIIASELHASVRLWTIPIYAKSSYQPTNFTGPETTISDFAVLPGGSFFVSSASSWTSRMFYTIKPGEKPNVLFTANEADPELAGLGPKDVSNFWYEGGDGDMIQCFVFYPTNFNPDKSYPLVFNVHGGPQSSQGDSWSTRWNLRMWADQGYIVTSPQFTGTPSYSQRFTDAIQGNWGGTPYRDLEKLYEYLEANVSYVNTSNAVAVGASYGGFMMNWIQGQPLGRKFRALVTHDGKLSQESSYGTDELWFIQQDQNGTIWDNRDNYERYDPLFHAKNFSTPHFVVHNDLDYRLPIAEGVMMFNVLQSLGVPSRFLHFPDEGHWVLSRENSLVWHRAIFNWIRYWTGMEKDLLMDIVITQ
ncbi:alpha/beta-hydrolase [Lindgomyces ingoldianus]|uniref:Alpha/beta-hydrolase n=1 Tax=Lindgomyces ingoldianus TaxID=673940 RepID=A0ACB6QQB6_9PLEO|nr:alpha/beta-hydrolase [Lindgomyces ingoldianus]KAF2469183.1 alpha/beta-hydrolase [Lindgomyces ingoldianus]